MTAIDTATTRAAALAAECCPATLTGGILSIQEAEQLARLLKALADPTRLRLLSMVAAHEGAEACVCDLTDPVGLTQGTVSHHMRVLVEAGILTREQRGKWAYYALVTNTLTSLAASIAHPSR